MICNVQNYETDFSRSEGDIDVALEDTQKSFEINLFGTIKVISAFLPLVRTSTLKKVVAISSGMGDIGESPAAAHTLTPHSHTSSFADVSPHQTSSTK